MAKRLGSTMERTISICDRDADIYEYLAYKFQNKQRFVVRLKVDRRIANEERRLIELLEQEAEEQCCYVVDIPQRGGRRARKAKVVARGMPLTLLPPGSSKVSDSLSVHGILVTEVDAPEGVEPLRWMLMTTEAIDTAERVRQIVRYYELRWRIEEYHKAWKSGVGVERQRFQSADNLERMLVITAFLAVRLLQLKEFMATPPGVQEPACDNVLTEDEWKVLWITTQRSTPPAITPSARWAYLAIARLGGFTDTKHTGRASRMGRSLGWMVSVTRANRRVSVE